MEAIVLEGQSLFDIAIQECGSVEAVTAIAVLNDISVTDDLQVGQLLQIPMPVNKQVAKYYKSHNLKPATAGNLDFTNKDEGIGYWRIGIDFIVS